MGILDKFTKEGTQLDNDKIVSYDKKTKLNPKSLQYSKLDLDGINPNKYNGLTKLNPQSLIGSKFDLDGKTPKKYLDSKPK